MPSFHPATDLGEQGKMGNYEIPQITFDTYFFTPVKEGLKHLQVSIIDRLHIKLSLRPYQQSFGTYLFKEGRIPNSNSIATSFYPQYGTMVGCREEKW